MKRNAPRFPVVHDLQYGPGSCYGAEEEAAIVEALRGNATSCGPRVAEFESAFAAYTGAAHAAAVSSGTSALELAMTALNVCDWDEVITTPISWIATANGAARRGARVVFADVDPLTLTLDPAAVRRKISPRTKAIIAVHLYGQPCDLDALLEIARDNKVHLVEDCAHAPGAEYKGRKVGSVGDLGIFSFGVQKNMTTLGEGGMIATNDAAIDERVRSHRWLCCRGYDPQGRYPDLSPESAPPMGKRYWYLEFDEVGSNARMTDMQAAAGLVQLRKLDSLNDRRRVLAERFTAGLEGVRGLTVPFVRPGVKHVFHVYCVLIEPGEFGMTKEEFMWRLWQDKGIKCLNHYMPIHLTKAYRNLGHGEGECPLAERLFERYVSLPIHPRLTDEAADYLVASVRDLASSR
jgi:dTDP-4-amino-4,6-dideoxygalactose transaminase